MCRHWEGLAAVTAVGFAVLERSGFEPSFTLSGGGADANVFNERGLACVNLANGMTDIHTPTEHISVADLESMVEVTLAIIDANLTRQLTRTLPSSAPTGAAISRRVTTPPCSTSTHAAPRPTSP